MPAVMHFTISTDFKFKSLCIFDLELIMEIIRFLALFAVAAPTLTFAAVYEPAEEKLRHECIAISAASVVPHQQNVTYGLMNAGMR